MFDIHKILHKCREHVCALYIGNKDFKKVCTFTKHFSALGVYIHCALKKFV